MAGLQPDYGPSLAAASAGVACIGATPWVTNLNIPLRTADMALCRQIAKALSARGGGLAAVEAMALPHSSGAPCMRPRELTCKRARLALVVRRLSAGPEGPRTNLGVKSFTGPANYLYRNRDHTSKVALNIVEP